MNIQKMIIADLKPADYNPRTISPEELEKLKRSIEEFGYLEPVIWNERTNRIIGGHQRVRAMTEMGREKEEIEVVVVDLPEGKEKALNVALNRISGEWDNEKLADLLVDFDPEDRELTAIDENEISRLLDSIELEIDADDDEVPEIPKESKAKLGDLYQLGDHRLLCGDATKIEDVERLMGGDKADMVFTDPPYRMNLDADYSGLSWGGRKGKKYENVIGDHDDFKPELIQTIFDNFGYCEEIFLWGADYYFELVPDFKKGHYIVWDKTLESNGDAGANSEYELIWTKTKHKRQVIHFNWFRFFGLQQQDIKTREHPTQKPLQVCEPFIEKYSKENNIIVDLFGGSGSTLIACENLNRKCYMMELDPKYIDVIIERWEKKTGQKAKLSLGD